MTQAGGKTLRVDPAADLLPGRSCALRLLWTASRMEPLRRNLLFYLL